MDSRGERGEAEISVTFWNDASYSSSSTSATGNTRVNVSNDRDEYNHLTDDQKDKLCEYCKDNKGNKRIKVNKKWYNSTKHMVTSDVAKQKRTK